MTEQAGYMAPTLRQRIWGALGFGWRGTAEMSEWRSADPGPEDWHVPGALVTKVVIRFDWRDRLRLLLSGTAAVEVSTRTDALVHRAESRSLVCVLPPGGADAR